MAKKIQHSDIIAPGNPAIDTIKGLEQLEAGINDLIKAVKKLKPELTKTFAGSKEVKQLSSDQIQAANAAKQMAAAQREATKAATSLNNQRQKALAVMAKQESQEHELITAATGEAKSLEQLQKKVSALIAIRKRLDLSTEAGRKEEQQYTAQIRKSQDTLKRYDAAIGNHQRNVGNYKSALGGLRQSFMAVSLAVTGAIMAFRTMSRFVSSAIAAADLQIRAETKVATAVKQTGMAAGYTADQLKAMASELQRKTRFGDEKILNEVTAQLLSFPAIAGSNFQLAQEAALDLATLLDGDLKSASIQLGKALQDPVKGMSALRRSGVMFSADQQNVIKNLAATNRLGEAQVMMLKEINRQYGGQAEAALAGAGGVEQLKNAWGDLKEIMGAALLDGMTFTDVMTQRLYDLNDILTSNLNGWQKTVGFFNSLFGFNNTGMAVKAQISQFNDLFDAQENLSKAQANHTKLVNDYAAATYRVQALERQQARNGAAEATRIRNLKNAKAEQLKLENERKASLQTIATLTRIATTEQDKANGVNQKAATVADKLTSSQIDLIQQYNEANDAELSLSKASYEVAKAWKAENKVVVEKLDALQQLNKEISDLETKINLAILKGDPFKQFIEKMVPKQKQIEEMNKVKDAAILLTSTLYDLGKGVKLLQAIATEKVKIDIDLDFGDEAGYGIADKTYDVKEAVESINEMMEKLSSQTATGLVPKTMLEQLGLTPDDVTQIKTALNTVMSEFTKLIDKRKELADEALANAQAATNQTIALLQIENEKRAAGLANQTGALEANLAQQQAAQAAALEEQKKASILQLRMQQIESASALITAAANTFKAWSTLPGIGQLAAVAQIAAMLGSFVGFQSQIRSLKMEKGGRFTEGDRGVIQGDRHSAASGGEWLSNQVQAERGEKVYVLSRRHSSGKAGQVMDSVFDRIQAGDRDLLTGVNRLIAPRIYVNQQPDRNITKLIDETRTTNSLLLKFKFFDPKTGIEYDLKGNKTVRN